MDWNECYLSGNTPWEKGHATPVLDEIKERHPDLFTGKVLVPGCGFGHDARRLAEMGMQVVGLDVSPIAVQRAREWHHQNSTAEFVLGDVFAMTENWQGSFDAVWEHTCFCALPPERRKDYADSMVSVLKRGGFLIGVFFINPEMDEGETGPPFGIEVDQLRLLWESVGMKWHDAWVPTTGYEGRIGRELAVVMQR